MNASSTIVWFRNDLRVDDNDALSAAVQRGQPILPVFIWAPEEEGNTPPGSASRWWLHQSLASLGAELERLGSRLLIRTGAAERELDKLIQESGADAVYWNRRYEPSAVQREKQLQSKLQKRGIRVENFGASLLFDPEEIRTKQGKPYQVFTPFWRACLSLPEPAEPLPPPSKIISPAKWPKSAALESLDLEPKIDWAAGIREAWTPGSAGAKQNVRKFLEDTVDTYQSDRDRPDLVGTSRLSPHLHFGEISPRQIWHAVKQNCSEDRRTSQGKGATTFLSELGWREFAHHVLYHFPHTPGRPLRENFESFPWIQGKSRLLAWQRGQTGYPIVDAGMRELWEAGWMHNRVRMVVGSFLTKDLLISWRAGAKWFWETLVDADLANNTLGWQWISGCGADAAPYFRVFNPVTQGKKFDPEGLYVRRWVPELEQLPNRWIHEPWNAPLDLLENAGVNLGQNYPNPIVDHAEARQAALAAFNVMKSR